MHAMQYFTDRIVGGIVCPKVQSPKCKLVSTVSYLVAGWQIFINILRESGLFPDSLIPVISFIFTIQTWEGRQATVPTQHIGKWNSFEFIRHKYCILSNSTRKLSCRSSAYHQHYNNIHLLISVSANVKTSLFSAWQEFIFHILQWALKLFIWKKSVTICCIFQSALGFLFQSVLTH